MIGRVYFTNNHNENKIIILKAFSSVHSKCTIRSRSLPIIPVLFNSFLGKIFGLIFQAVQVSYYFLRSFCSRVNTLDLLCNYPFERVLCCCLDAAYHIHLLIHIFIRESLNKVVFLDALEVELEFLLIYFWASLFPTEKRFC
ncbi:unnamed protein product [Moneuplotes crassus]|uniref:Uncharacterized protein n=1 Tax=Euplotes crassus TaxID=5936 RepID=A0AAD1XPY1_EUPCR|nr:unnamed protein product [Moneuplotes crassus]